MTFESTTIDEVIQALTEASAARGQHREQFAAVYASLGDTPEARLIEAQLALIDVVGGTVSKVGMALVRYLDDEAALGGEHFPFGGA